MTRSIIVTNRALNLCAILVVLVVSAAFAGEDPVDQFIVSADSLARTGGDDALGAFVREHRIIVGAAVGALLDAAFDASQTGNRAGEAENVALAERVAALHGSDSTRALVHTYRAWDSAARAIKVRAMALETQATEARNARNYDAAAALFEEARGLYEQIGDRRSIAINYGSLGVVHWYRTDMNAVRKNYELALEARRAIEDRILEGRTLNGLGSMNLRTGQYDAAVAFYREAIDLRRRTGDIEGLGTSLTYLGTCFYQMNRLVEARDVFEEALPVLERVGRPDQMIAILNSVANLYTDMGRLKAANDSYRRAIDIAAEVEAPTDEATCRINLADNLQRVGKYREALAQLDAASKRLEVAPEPYRLADLYRNRAQVYLNTGETDLARENLVLLREQAEGLGEPLYWISAGLMTAQMYMTLGAYDKGVASAEEAIVTARRNEVVRMEREGEAVAARLEMRRGRYDVALSHWRRALAIDQADGSESGQLEARLGVASVLALSGEREAARAAYWEVLPHAEAAGLVSYLGEAHLGIAHTYEAQNPDSASIHYATALALYERGLRDLGGAEASGGYLSGERRFVYEEVARYYAKLHAETGGTGWSDRAFQTLEAAKARGLLDLLRGAEAYESSESEEALLDSLYSVAASTPGDTRRLTALEREYHAARSARVSRSVGALEAGDEVTETISLSDVQSSLDKGSVMLSYALGDTASMVWVIDRKGVDLFALPNRTELARDIERLRDAITRPGPGDAVLRSTARRLYEVLLAPLGSRLERARRVVIAPDGVLFELPFELLIVSDAGDGAAWSDLDFVAELHDVVYVPSASVYVTLRRNEGQRDYDLDLVALGDPEYAPASGLDRLPYTREEVRAIAEGVDDNRQQTYLGADASEASLKSALGSHQPRIVHLAAHGLVDPHQPAASSVALGAADGEDGYLHTLEITALPLQVGLVVLSACESARGRMSRSEGVVGLSRAFLASGAGGVVASLWAVSDESTSVLMKEFYRRMLGKKKTAAQALREARVALLKSNEYSHPFHWAPFVAIGTESSPW